MTSLNSLEERLRLEVPTVAWDCRSVHNSTILGTDVPEQIEITAHSHGGPMMGSPWRVRGSMLIRWGVDATAKLIVQNFPSQTMARRGLSWDKLAEI